MSETIEDTLKDRGTKYGGFTAMPVYIARPEKVMVIAPKWQRFSQDKREVPEMVQHKIARILHGNPEFHESWHDGLRQTRCGSRETP